MDKMKKNIQAEFSSYDMAEEAVHMIKSRCKNLDGVRITSKNINEYQNKNDAVFSNFFAPAAFAETGIPVENGLLPDAFNSLAALQNEEYNDIKANSKTARIEVTVKNDQTSQTEAIIRSFGGTGIKIN